jgi:hypothetical protein
VREDVWRSNTFSYSAQALPSPPAPTPRFALPEGEGSKSKMASLGHTRRTQFKDVCIELDFEGEVRRKMGEFSPEFNPFPPIQGEKKMRDRT